MLLVYKHKPEYFDAVNEGSSLTIVNQGSSVTIVNKGLSLTIVSKTTNIYKNGRFCENYRF